MCVPNNKYGLLSLMVEVHRDIDCPGRMLGEHSYYRSIALFDTVMLLVYNVPAVSMIIHATTSSDLQRSKEAIYADLDQRLKAKCLQVVQLHTPQKEVGGSDALQLARVGQLPQLLTQQKEEERRMEQELEQLRQDYDKKVITRHKVRDCIVA